MSWKIGWNTLTHQICLDDPRVNLMVRRNLRIWICIQSLDFFSGKIADNASKCPPRREQTRHASIDIAHVLEWFGDIL
jgi:hypothetical protein